MKSIILNLLAAVFISTFLFSCVKEDDGIYFNETSEVVDIENVSYSEIELEILDLVNAHRKSIGIAELSTLNIVSAVADGHTQYMIQNGKISHDNFAQRAQTLEETANAKTVGENVAYGYATAQSVLNGWLNSEPHRKVLENPSFTHFGISTKCNGSGRNFFTQIFIKK